MFSDASTWPSFRSRSIWQNIISIILLDPFNLIPRMNIRDKQLHRKVYYYTFLGIFKQMNGVEVIKFMISMSIALKKVKIYFTISSRIAP